MTVTVEIRIISSRCKNQTKNVVINTFVSWKYSKAYYIYQLAVMIEIRFFFLHSFFCLSASFTDLQGDSHQLMSDIRKINSLINEKGGMTLLVYLGNV